MLSKSSLKPCRLPVRSVASAVSDSFWPWWLLPARPLCPWDSPGKITGVGCHALLQGNLPDPGIEPASPVSPALQIDSLLTEPPGKPRKHVWQALKIFMQNFPGDPVVKIPACNPGDPGSVPGPGSSIPHAGTVKPVHRNYWALECRDAPTTRGSGCHSKRSCHNWDLMQPPQKMFMFFDPVIFIQEIHHFKIKYKILSRYANFILKKFGHARWLSSISVPQPGIEPGPLQWKLWIPTRPQRNILRARILIKEFPGGPVVKTRHYHCCVLSSVPVGELRSCKPWGQPQIQNKVIKLYL